MQRVDDTSRHTQHRVAPRRRDIAFGNIHASDIAYPTIDDNQLAVVAVVHLRSECGEVDGKEGMYLNTLFTHTFKEAAPNLPTAHIVVDDTDTHTFTSFVYEGICHQVSKSIIFDNIHIDVDMMGSRSDVVQ